MTATKTPTIPCVMTEYVIAKNGMFWASGSVFVDETGLETAFPLCEEGALVADKIAKHLGAEVVERSVRPSRKYVLPSSVSKDVKRTNVCGTHLDVDDVVTRPNKSAIQYLYWQESMGGPPLRETVSYYKGRGLLTFKDLVTGETIQLIWWRVFGMDADNDAPRWNVLDVPKGSTADGPSLKERAPT